MKSKIFCLVGASGSGKDSIKEAIGLPYIVSYRTRTKRDNEIDGIHGHFVDESLYHKHKSKGLIAGETLYNGAYYWTTKDQFKLYSENKSHILYVVDGDGVKTLRQVFPEDDVIGIYINVDEEFLKARMRVRGDSPENIESRMKYYHDVVKHDNKVCDYQVDNNRELIYALNKVYKIILEETIKI